jgi:hypothetical protein
VSLRDPFSSQESQLLTGSPAEGSKCEPRGEGFNGALVSLVAERGRGGLVAEFIEQGDGIRERKRYTFAPGQHQSLVEMVAESMGITDVEALSRPTQRMPRNPLSPHEARLLEGIPIGSMCELGAKQKGKYKRYLQSIGWLHVSIDLNGTGGALALDLQEPIDMAAIGGPFDVVTNFGTTEHVDEQEPCWRNIHALTAGFLISITPIEWQGHGRWYPTRVWYEQFCELNGYDIESIEEISANHPLLALRARKRVTQDFTFPTAPMTELSGGKTGAYR